MGLLIRLTIVLACCLPVSCRHPDGVLDGMKFDEAFVDANIKIGMTESAVLSIIGNPSKKFSFMGTLQAEYRIQAKPSTNTAEFSGFCVVYENGLVKNVAKSWGYP